MIRIKDIILVAIVFVLWLLFFKNSSYIPPKADFTNMRNYRKIVEVHDTVYQQKTFTKYKKGKDIQSYIILTDTEQVYVHDTVHILSDYMRKYVYSDTINQDSNNFVITDTISQNKILSRSFEAKITKKTIVSKVLYVEKPKNALYLGFRGDFRQDNGLVVLSPSLILSVKNKALIGFGLDLYGIGGFGYSGSLYLKLGKK
jgi:ABC-type sugar transport system permease subunit